MERIMFSTWYRHVDLANRKKSFAGVGRHLFQPHMCIVGLSSLGSEQSLSLSNYTPSSWSRRRMLCACMCTNILVFRPQKVLLWYSQPNHMLWYFPDDQSIHFNSLHGKSQPVPFIVLSLSWKCLRSFFAGKRKGISPGQWVPSLSLYWSLL